LKLAAQLLMPCVFNSFGQTAATNATVARL
jgi:hypothetical protein